MRIGSLFSGIGGLELGLERAGVGQTIWQVEQDEYCRRVLAKHWPDAQRFIDVRDVGAHNLPAVDVICGGFPCQDVAAPGRRRGVVAGTRSGLWFEYSRIIRELRPRYAIVENVGAPHERDRVFVVAYPSGDGLPFGGSWNEGLHAVATGGEWLWGKPRRSGPDGRKRAVPHTHSDGLQGLLPGCDDTQERPLTGEGPIGLRDRTRGNRAWLFEPDVVRVAHGVPERAQRIKALGNAVVPQVAEVVGRVLLQIHQELEMSEQLPSVSEAP